MSSPFVSRNPKAEDMQMELIAFGSLLATLAVGLPMVWLAARNSIRERQRQLTDAVTAAVAPKDRRIEYLEKRIDELEDQLRNRGNR